MQALLGCVCGVLLRPHPLGGVGLPPGDEGAVGLHEHAVSRSSALLHPILLLLLVQSLQHVQV